MRILPALVILALLLPASAQADNWRSAIVVDERSGVVLYENNIKQLRSPASLTKMMTALVALEHIKNNKKIKIHEHSFPNDAQQLGLVEGEVITRNDLLRGALITSASDAAMALADSASGNNQKLFIKWMNDYASRLGMRRTHFMTIDGMDKQGQFSTAEDMALLGAALIEHPLLRNIVSSPSSVLESGAIKREVFSTNALLGNNVTGIKTGFTDQAGFSFVGRAHRGSKRVIIVLMGAPSSAQRFVSANFLFNQGFSKLQNRRVFTSHKVNVLGYGEQATLKFANQKLLALPNNAQIKITGLPSQIRGPLKANQRVAYAKAYINGHMIAGSNVYTVTSVMAPPGPDTLSLAGVSLLGLLMGLGLIWKGRLLN
jgi:D-alanyl-D-alanine carboxypeptidase